MGTRLKKLTTSFIVPEMRNVKNCLYGLLIKKKNVLAIVAKKLVSKTNHNGLMI